MPSPIEKLQKFLKLEAERGYDNRAVVGGLDKILPSWQSEAQSTSIPPELIQTVVARLNEYRDLDAAARAESLNNLLALLQSLPQAVREERPAVRPERSEPRNMPRPPLENEPSRFSQPQNGRPARPPRPAEAVGPVGLNAPLTVLQGVGPKTAQNMRALGINTLGDLLYYFPRRYDDYSQLKPINRLNYGEECTVLGTVHSSNTRPIRGGQSSITEAVITDGTAFMKLTWFNQPWLVSRLQPGYSLVASGKVEMYLGRLVMNNPEVEQLEQEHLHTNRIVPVYPLSGRMTQRSLRRDMYQLVNFWATRIPDYLPESVRQSAGLIDLATALSQVHFPDSQTRLQAARARLAFDEIFLLQLGVLRQKRAWQDVSARVFDTPDDWMESQIARLPYPLTGAQQRVLADVRTDLAAGRPMNRLLQGDVGSGKTVVAALAIAMITRHGAQAALMAPTSILAEQHMRSLQSLLAGTPEDAGVLQPAEIRLLVGDTREAEKAEIRAGLADGSIKLVIGTHALLEDPVTFQNLQLAVVDEQHRFGVAQRAILRNKGENPHLLVMTATPIPRSLALTIYGDLDISVMDEMPAGRQPVETHVLSPLERERAYTLIRSQVTEGRQAFIIYPLVEDTEGDGNNAAVNEHTRLQQEIFPHYRLGLLHGRMRPDEKDDMMVRFRDGEFQVLVSTSVVEVGVDVPNATVMLVEGANRFGLAQLHQFRGRVGRGSSQSFCLLIPDTEDAVENERLAVMAETNDGFVLAERDLAQRGPGDFLGTRQSGYMDLKMANLSDVRLIEKARQQAQALFAVDPDLSQPQHELLDKTFRRFWGGGRGDMS